jgi:hypothetical protein
LAQSEQKPASGGRRLRADEVDEAYEAFLLENHKKKLKSLSLKGQGFTHPEQKNRI